MELVEPDLELRNAIVSYFWAKGGGERVSRFLFDFQIESIYVYYIKHGDFYQKVMHVKPKFSKKKNMIIGIMGIYQKVIDVSKIVNTHKDLNNYLLKTYDEPYPGFYSNMNPWSRKKQKPKKGRKNGRI